MVSLLGTEFCHWGLGPTQSIAMGESRTTHHHYAGQCHGRYGLDPREERFHQHFVWEQPYQCSTGCGVSISHHAFYRLLFGAVAVAGEQSGRRHIGPSGQVAVFGIDFGGMFSGWYGVQSGVLDCPSGCGVECHFDRVLDHFGIGSHTPLGQILGRKYHCCFGQGFGGRYGTCRAATRFAGYVLSVQSSQIIATNQPLHTLWLGTLGCLYLRGCRGGKFGPPLVFQNLDSPSRHSCRIVAHDRLWGWLFGAQTALWSIGNDCSDDIDRNGDAK